MARKTPVSANLEELSAYLSELGRRGGSKKVKKGFASLTKQQRKDVARNAANARWNKPVNEDTKK